MSQFSSTYSCFRGRKSGRLLCTVKVGMLRWWITCQVSYWMWMKSVSAPTHRSFLCTSIKASVRPVQTLLVTPHTRYSFCKNTQMGRLQLQYGWRRNRCTHNCTNITQDTKDFSENRLYFYCSKINNVGSNLFLLKERGSVTKTMLRPLLPVEQNHYQSIFFSPHCQ